MASIPGRAQPTFEMPNQGEQDPKHVMPRMMNEFAGSLASNLTHAVDKWSREVSHLLSENARLSAELRDLKERTASVASQRAVRDPKNEDITDPNRPTRIKQFYKEFTDGDRMDAVDALEKAFPDKHFANPRLVCEIFEVAFAVATVAITSVREHLPRTLVNPASLRTPPLNPQQQRAEREPIEVCFKYSTIPESETHYRDADITYITRSISAYLRRTSSSVDITAMKQDVLSGLESKYPPDKQSLLRKKLRFVQNFISDCCKLAWLLVVQTPSMHIQYSERKFDQVKHELSSLSKSTTSNRICHYLWPTLLSNLNGNVLCKGVVVIGDSEV